MQQIKKYIVKFYVPTWSLSAGLMTNITHNKTLV